MIDNLDHLRRMAIFATVVDAGGFTAAARRLGLSRAAVSKQIAVLEDGLGARVLHRTTRSIQLTEVGAQLYPRCQAIVEQAGEAWTQVQAHVEAPRGRLTISAPLGLGESWLAPLLPGFLDAYPEVDLTVQLTDERVNLVNEGVDVALRAGAMPDSALIARRLTGVELVVCAAPDYLAGATTLAAPEDLTAHDWITYAPLGLPNRLTFRRHEETQKVRLSGRVTTNNGGVIRELLLASQGISILPRFYVQKDLTAGTLIEVLRAWSMPSAPVYAVYPHARHVALKVRALIDYLALNTAAAGGAAPPPTRAP